MKKMPEQRIQELELAIKAAIHALRSYQAGNDSPDLAEEIADKLASILARPSATTNTTTD